MPGNDTERKELQGPSALPRAQKVAVSHGTDAPKSQQQPQVRLRRKTPGKGKGSLVSSSNQTCARPGTALDTRDRLLSPGTSGDSTTSPLLW